MHSYTSPICPCNRLGHEKCTDRIRRWSGVDKWQPVMWFGLRRRHCLVVYMIHHTTECKWWQRQWKTQVRRLGCTWMWKNAIIWLLAYDEIVVSDFNSERHGQCAVQGEARARQENVLTSVCQHRYGEVNRTRTSACQYDVLYTHQHQHNQRQYLKVKVRRRYSALRYGARYRLRNITVLPAHLRVYPLVYPQTVWNMPSQPKLVLILPTPEGWKAECHPSQY